MKKKIDFIYFDLGNVILKFDHRIACRRVAALAGMTEDDVHRIVFESTLQSDFEAGRLQATEFATQFAVQSNRPIEHDQLLTAISDIFWLNRAIVPVLTQLRVAGFPIGILSNTCSAHWQFVLKRFPVLRQTFRPNQRVLSYEVGAMKPEAEIYEQAAAVAGVAPEQIFFTDDREDNVAGALRAGWQAEPFESVSRLIRRLECGGVRLNL